MNASVSDRSLLLDRLQAAIAELDPLFHDDRLSDANVDAELHRWLDGDDVPLVWADPVAVTPDEWFFITTLYGEMAVDVQRTHLRAKFPTLFVAKANRDIRNFRPPILKGAGLRSPWMEQRLYKMAELLRDRGQTMSTYTAVLKDLEKDASPKDPMPALDAMVLHLGATGWKTLSVFVRDCVGGNSFPIDSRVQKELDRYRLPTDERLLVSLALELNRNPRQIARMFHHVADQR